MNVTTWNPGVEPDSWSGDARILVGRDPWDGRWGNETIAGVFATMASHSRYKFFAATEHPQRAAKWFGWVGGTYTSFRGIGGPLGTKWPLPNVAIGVTVRNQADVDAAIDSFMRDIPAAVTWIDYVACEEIRLPEPGIGFVDWLRIRACDRPRRVPTDGSIGIMPAHVRSAVEQARAAGVPVYVDELAAVTAALGSREWTLDWPTFPTDAEEGT